MTDGKFDDTSNQVIDYLKNLDQRISRIEEKMGYALESEPLPEVEPPSKPLSDEMPDSFEIKLGEYWFAYIGIFVLIVGCLLLMTHPASAAHPLIPSITGLVVGVAMFIGGNVFRNTYKFIALQLWSAAYILLWFATFRFFNFLSLSMGEVALVQNLVLLFVSGLAWLNSNQHKSAYLNVVSITLMAFTAVLLDHSFFTPLILLGVAALFVFTYQRSNRIAVLIYGNLLVLLTHLQWALGNPILTHHVNVVPQISTDLTFLLLYVVVFSTTLYFKRPTEEETAAEREFVLYANAITNGLAAFLIYTTLLFLHRLPSIMPAETALFVVYFGLAIWFWRRAEINIYTIVFTLLSFGALSIGFIQSTDVPDVYIYLIWQSLFVLAAAIWFRSKFIVVANFLIFLMVFISYSAVAGFAGIISISFGVVALISARILNWRKHRLTLQTEMMRNTYLFVAFLSIPFTLLKSLPAHWVGLSWLALAILYYGIGLLLKNGKYRWMAHFTLLATILYILVYATTGIEPTYRILTFIVLGIVLISLSIMFARYRIKLNPDNAQTSENNHA